jgi:DeoR family transcriptional regulator, glycerol-3-phosphate regulon repressor
MNFETIIRKKPDAPASSHMLRQAQILARLNASGFQSIADLSAAFNVSAQTMRRDVNALALHGMCRRSHGGIWPVQGLRNTDYAERREIGHAAKQCIAELVAEQVPDGSSIFLGIGTTLELCAAALGTKKNLRVMTNNLHAVVALSRNAETEICIPGGRVRNLDLDIVSAEAHGFFDRYEVDIGIFGVGAVSSDGMLLDFQEDEAHMRHELARNCRRKFLVFDASKFDRRATVRQGQITDVDAIFTDRPPPPQILEMVNAAGIQLFMPRSVPPTESL